MRTIPGCLLPRASAQGQEQRGQQLVQDMAIVYEKKKKKCFLKPTKNTHSGEEEGGGGEKPPSLSSQQLGRVGSSLEAGKSPPLPPRSRWGRLG